MLLLPSTPDLLLRSPRTLLHSSLVPQASVVTSPAHHHRPHNTRKLSALPHRLSKPSTQSATQVSRLNVGEVACLPSLLDCNRHALALFRERKGIITSSEIHEIVTQTVKVPEKALIHLLHRTGSDCLAGSVRAVSAVAYEMLHSATYSGEVETTVSPRRNQKTKSEVWRSVKGRVDIDHLAPARVRASRHSRLYCASPKQIRYIVVELRFRPYGWYM
ncbi:hypothetical protein KC316_g6 [Hortaea werneckii]|nr:hypothetical protein KC316_g6 [Hortaea werneckii]